ncbi:MAG: hypothetical protein Q4D44_00820 [Eubacteriales bacterium]|nr:hypothetical protein [Eubacteriales bacterium]
MSIRDLQKDDIKNKGKIFREKAQKVSGEIKESLPASGTMTGTGHSFFQWLQSFAASSGASALDPSKVLSVFTKGFSLPIFGAVTLLFGGIVAVVVAFFKLKK